MPVMQELSSNPEILGRTARKRSSGGCLTLTHVHAHTEMQTAALIGLSGWPVPTMRFHVPRPATDWL